jgi:hypothetical protein
MCCVLLLMHILCLFSVLGKSAWRIVSLLQVRLHLCRRRRCLDLGSLAASLLMPGSWLPGGMQSWIG